MGMPMRSDLEASNGWTIPFSPEGIDPPPTSEREIAVLERIMLWAGFPDERVAERVGFWRRNLTVQTLKKRTETE